MSEPEIASIVSLTEDGRGLCDLPGKKVLVPDVLKGEQISLVRGRRRRNHEEGRLVEVLQGAPDRVEPRCEYFGLCGGCVLQHMKPRKQWEFKQKLLADKLGAAGLDPQRWLPPLSGPEYGYRRRARLGVKDVPGKGRVLVGFRERGKPYITVMDRCAILAPPAGDLLRPLADLIGSLTLHNRLPQIEVAVGDNATALVFRILAEPASADLVALEAFAKRYDVRIYLQPAGPDSVYALREYSSMLHYGLPDFDISIEFEPTDFLQINSELNRRMVAQAVDLLAPSPSERVLDLFCGLGNFSLPLARRARRVVGVEGDVSLVARARRNAARNGLDNLEFHQSDLFTGGPDEPWQAQGYDCILLDPPRAGAERIIGQVATLGGRRIVYVSCHPDTLARDAALLVREQGYHFVAAAIMDMFPHTAHVEAMAVFDRHTKE